MRLSDLAGKRDSNTRGIGLDPGIELQSSPFRRTTDCPVRRGTDIAQFPQELAQPQDPHELINCLRGERRKWLLPPNRKSPATAVMQSVLHITSVGRKARTSA
jgi:hypothetical protein